jgi:hypothetical protein
MASDTVDALWSVLCFLLLVSDLSKYLVVGQHGLPMANKFSTNVVNRQ